jgi:hypothetical protein
MTNIYTTPVDGIVLSGVPIPSTNGVATPVWPNPGVEAGRKFCIPGQTVNKVTGGVANQQAGTALLSSAGGTVTAGSTNTVVVANTLVTAASVVFLTAANEDTNGTFGGDGTAGRGMAVWLESVGAGTLTIGFRPAANMAADWSCNYLIVT